MQGPFPRELIATWFTNEVLPLNLQLRPEEWSETNPLWLELPQVWNGLIFMNRELWGTQQISFSRFQNFVVAPLMHYYTKVLKSASQSNNFNMLSTMCNKIAICIETEMNLVYGLGPCVLVSQIGSMVLPGV